MTLYVVATPIGNLEDMTPRAVRVLQEVDIIAAEDTRHSRILLSHFNIKNTQLYSCHKFNEERRGDFFVSKMLEGQTVALISDAGTPCISDPGHRLVSAAAEAGIDVVAVCGASAVVGALSVSGFDVTGFRFLGFLPRKKRDIADCLREVFPCTVVFYESPKRIEDTIGVLDECFSDAKICLCNDITKKFEKLYRGNPSEVLQQLRENENSGKGEYTCVVNVDSVLEEDKPDDDVSLESQIIDIMVKTNDTLKGACDKLRLQNEKLSKKEIYKAMLNLKNILGADHE